MIDTLLLRPASGGRSENEDFVNWFPHLKKAPSREWALQTRKSKKRQRILIIMYYYYYYVKILT